MTWFAWLFVGYIVGDRLFTVAWIGRTLEITKTVAVVSLFTGALLVWGTFALAAS